MAQKKAGGTTKNGRDSQSKRLGLKVADSGAVNPGSILVRQRGTIFSAGHNVRTGKDYTLYSAVAGVAKFTKKKGNQKVVAVYQKVSGWPSIVRRKTKVG